jgi:3alpha(or 20beta)-hydroxysteroid dehydrogenase
MGRVDGKVVLITGAASGQGAAGAAAVVAEGAQVIATDIQDPLETPPAGVTFRRLDEVDLDDWDRVLRINLTSAMLGIQAITPLMTDGGSVVNISSRAGLSGHFTVAYTTAKWGLRGLSRVASMELGPKGIRCNCLFPGYIDTPMVRTAPEAFVEASLKEIPMGRKGTPDDIAPLVVYLISDESTYVNGTEISVDGGEWAHGGTKVYSDLLRGMDVRNG